MNFDIFNQIGMVPSVISDLKKELIGMQYSYAIEKAQVLRDFCTHGIATKGTYKQYSEILEKLFKPVLGYKNIHDILTEEEIKLFGSDSYIEENYLYWYSDMDRERN